MLAHICPPREEIWPWHRHAPSSLKAAVTSQTIGFAELYWCNICVKREASEHSVRGWLLKKGQRDTLDSRRAEGRVERLAHRLPHGVVRVRRCEERVALGLRHQLQA